MCLKNGPVDPYGRLFPALRTVAGSRPPCETDDEVSRLKTTRVARNDDEAPPRGNFAFERETPTCIDPGTKVFPGIPHFSLRLINRVRDFHPISAFDSRPRLLSDSLARYVVPARRNIFAEVITARQRVGAAANSPRGIAKVDAKAEVTAAAAAAPAPAPAPATAAARG